MRTRLRALAAGWSSWVGWTAVFVIAADWSTKVWIRNRIALHETTALVEGWVHLVHRRNEGIAFSMLSDAATAWRLPLLITASLLAIVLLLRLAGSSTSRLVRLATALMLGGAIGNLVDRIADGGVTDFVLLRFFPYVFNVADMAITVGGCILAITLMSAKESEDGTVDTTVAADN